MACEYCHREGYHLSRCPLFTPQKAKHYCSICDEGIYEGEEYIENLYGEYAHWECVDYGRELARWLGHEIRTMENDL